MSESHDQDRDDVVELWHGHPSVCGPYRDPYVAPNPTPAPPPDCVPEHVQRARRYYDALLELLSHTHLRHPNV